MSKSPRAIRPFVVRFVFVLVAAAALTVTTPGTSAAAYSFLDDAKQFFGYRSVPINAAEQDDPGKSSGIPADYNARNEFSLTQGGTTGVWRYGYSASDANHAFTEFTVADTIAACGGNFGRWYIPNPDVVPQIARHDLAAACFNIPPEALFIHPGESGRRAVLRWTAPAAGTYQLAGSLQRQVSNATSDLKIVKNETEPALFSGSIVSTYQTAFNVTVTVQANDKIDFSVGGGNGSHISDGSTIVVDISQPVTACQIAPANLQVSVPGEFSPSDVQSVNTNATLVGDASYTNMGKVGRAFNFDGTGDYVRIEDNPAQKPINQITVEGWFYFNTLTGVPHLVAKPVRNSVFDSYSMWYDNGNIRIGYYQTNQAFNYYDTGYVPQTGVWTHYAFVLNTDDAGPTANTQKLLVNGVEVFSGVAGNPIFYNGINDALAPHPLLVGADLESNVPSFFLNGQADEVSIYDRALSQPELFELVKQGSFGKCSPPRCAEAPKGLVSWFQGEANAIDSRSSNHGTNNGATFANGKVGQAYSLDGIGQHVTFGNTAGNFGTSDFTVEFWIQTSNNRLEEIVSKRVCGVGNGIHFFDVRKFGDGRILAELGNGSSAIALFSTQTVTDGSFHHIAIRRSGDTFSMYIDGALETSDIGVNAMGINLNNGAPFVIGALACIGVDTTQPFTGIIDEVSLYSKALSITEIQSINTAGQSGKCKPSPLDPPSNQIAWLTGDGDGRDFAGLDNNGTLSGTTFGVGKVGQAFQFDGVDDYISFASPPTTATDNWTMEAWINPANLSQQSMVMSNGFDDGSSGNGYTFGIGNGCTSPGSCGPGNRLQGLLSGIAFLDGGFTFPAANQWYHVVMLRESGTIKFYVNGVQTPSTSTAAPTTPTQFRIGSQTGIRFFNGLIDEASIYGRGLSASEVAAIYNAGVAGKLKQAVTPVGFSRTAPSKQAAKSAVPQVVTTVLSDATVTFAQVTTGGTTSQSGIDLGLLPPLPLPTTFTGLAYDVSTTAVFTTATVCFNLPSFNDSAQFARLRILHLESGNWMNRTDPVNSDFGTRTLCSSSVNSLSPFVIVELLAPSAANVSLGGRVTTADGRGITNAALALSGGGLTAPRTVITSSFGYYQFDGLEAGATYVVTIGAKRFRFADPSRVITLSDSITDFDFTANPQE